ncbi:MAG: LPXTG cell wall anchor domain-containing protein [Lactobacillus sp.]|jgi:LPXTG-motif cell wall-anchored protein|nr:LPXTG cell wall anchor domain-containing protein [Lactobacillus sp.]
MPKIVPIDENGNVITEAPENHLKSIAWSYVYNIDDFSKVKYAPFYGYGSISGSFELDLRPWLDHGYTLGNSDEQKSALEKALKRLNYKDKSESEIADAANGAIVPKSTSNVANTPNNVFIVDNPTDGDYYYWIDSSSAHFGYQSVANANNGPEKDTGLASPIYIMLKVNPQQPVDPGTPTTPTTEPVTDSKTITRTINVVDPTTGETTTTKQTVTLTRSGTKNTTTGETTWGDWSTGEWPKFDAPEFKGYTPSQAIVPDQTVTADTQDVTITITYTKDKTDQGGKTDKGDKNDKGGSNTNRGTTGKTTISNGNTNHTRTAGVSTIAGHQGLTVKAQPKQQALPQTNGENNFAIFGWLAAGLSALFGLAGIKRRKHE